MSETKRRDFLKILGIGSAAGLAGCSKTAPEPLTPYVVPPEEMVRGHALWFRTTCRECPAGCGLQVRVREGRAHKVEGSPEHPVNGGGICARGQAAVQGIYDPDRLRSPMLRDPKGQLQPATWDAALERVRAALSSTATRPDSVGLMTGCETGTFDALAAEFLSAFHSSRHFRYEPIGYEGLRAADRLMFGVDTLPVYRFAEARAIYVFGADVLETFVSPAGYTRGITEARRAGGRMVYIGPRLSLTGARADQWVAADPGKLAMALVRELAGPGNLKTWSAPFTPEMVGVPAEVIHRLVAEIRAKPFLAVTGGTAAPDVATAIAVNLLNLAAGAVNKTVRFDRGSALDHVSSAADLSGLDTLIIAGANPVYASRSIHEALRKIPLVVALSSYPSETVNAAHVVLPVHTPLESWGDYEPWTGLHCLQQPAMSPVFQTRQAGDVLLTLMKGGTYRDYLRARWKKFAGSQDFESFWAACLERGGLWQDVQPREVRLASVDLGPHIQTLWQPQPKGPYHLQTYPSLAHFDGRGANRPWLQELPDPITQVVWDSWVEISPQDARALRLQTGDQVRVRSPHGQIETAAYVYPGIAPGLIAMPLGQGHSGFGRYAEGIGANAMTLLDPAPDPASGGTQWSSGGITIERLPRKEPLVRITEYDLQEGRRMARSRDVPGRVEPAEHVAALSLYAAHEHKLHRWAMLIDLDACTACSACVTACYAENNVPVVGKDQVNRGRHMSWIRIERFFGKGARVSEPFRIDWTPMLCQHCDNAPCEPVCPVFAAYHTEEGLNGQVYNRCVGTRYCSNNCPYKARRFNWYEADWPAPLDWQLNPDVTVRSKGVMEKCTFCIQRIVEAKDRAKREGRALADGDVVPACAQSCPAKAIVFGDLKDPNSRVARLLKSERRYQVLEELNTHPAVNYLERQRRLV